MDNINTADPNYDRKGYIKRMTRKDRADFNLAHNPKYYSDLAKQRRKPYYHFKWLKRNRPDEHKKISGRGGSN